MKYNDLVTPSGTKDYLFSESDIKKQIKEKLSKCFELSGYKQINTPGIEFYDVFEQNSHYFPQEKMYKFTDNKNRLLVLRPDSTIPIARVVATRLKNAALPLRIFYDQPVYRYVQELKGQSVQTDQMGIEMVGSSSVFSDLEVASTAVEVLEAVDEDYTIEIGNAAIFKELISMLDISDEKKEEIRTYIESKNYPMLQDSLKTLGNNSVTNALKELPSLFGGKEVFEKARKVINIKKIVDIIDDLEKIFDLILELVPKSRLSCDLGMANKIDYYTGIIFKGYVDGYGKEIISGGRYDKLLSEFDYDVPAIGFAINVDAICMVKCRNHKIAAKPTDIIIHPEEGYEYKALKIAKEYRKKGFVTEISLFDDKETLLEYAKEKKINKVIVVNGDN